jgi:hypothetical protein
MTALCSSEHAYYCSHVQQIGSRMNAAVDYSVRDCRKRSAKRSSDCFLPVWWVLQSVLSMVSNIIVCSF